VVNAPMQALRRQFERFYFVDVDRNYIYLYTDQLQRIMVLLFGPFLGRTEHAVQVIAQQYEAFMEKCRADAAAARPAKPQRPALRMSDNARLMQANRLRRGALRFRTRLGGFSSSDKKQSFVPGPSSNPWRMALFLAEYIRAAMWTEDDGTLNTQTVNLWIKHWESHQKKLTGLNTDVLEDDEELIAIVHTVRKFLIAWSQTLVFECELSCLASAQSSSGKKKSPSHSPVVEGALAAEDCMIGCGGDEEDPCTALVVTCSAEASEHAICTKCLHSYVTITHTNADVSQIPCILAPDCKSYFSVRTLQKALDPLTLAKMDDNATRRNMEAAHGPNDSSLIVCACGWSGTADRGTKCVTCPTCRSSYCTKCGEYFHEGSCAASDIDQSTLAYLAQNTHPCPNCKQSIERVSGCNAMMCRECKYEFCWTCGGEAHTHGTCSNVVQWAHA
jgi:hypothetical protein